MKSIYLMLLSLLLTTNVFAYSGGTGSIENPYQITTAAELITLGNTPADCNKCFILMNDIDFGPTNINQTCIIPEFSGCFDGAGFGIYNFTNSVNYDLSKSAGVFGMITNATVMNLYVLDSKVSNPDYSYAGLVAGSAMHSTILNCETSGTVEGYRYSGGVVGRLYYSLIDSSSSSITMTGNHSAGGIVGLMQDSTIRNCESDANLTFSTHHIAGIAGFVFDSTVDRCHSSGSASGDSFIGGVIGRAYDSIISNSYSSSTISGRDDNGGFIGNSVNCLIANSYSYGEILENNDANGFIGTRSNSDITNCFWNPELSGKTTDPAATGITSNQMANVSTFTDANWDFDSVWTMSEESPYFPELIESITVYSGGRGTRENPYEITTAAELITLGNTPADCDKYFILKNDIDFGSDNVDQTCIIPEFSGSFDGDDYGIYNFTNSANYDLSKSAGLFGMITNATVMNLCVLDSKVSNPSYSHTGLLVGKAMNSTILNCETSGTVSGYRFTGGVVGWLYHSELDSSVSTVSMYGDQSGGGIVGLMHNSNLSRCESVADLTYSTHHIAGIAGFVFDSTIDRCHSSGSVSGDTFIGGVIGRAYDSIISNSYSSSTISGKDDNGGFVGNTVNCSIKDSYSYGKILGNNDANGFIGTRSNSDIINCFWNTELSGKTTDPAATGIPSEQMQDFVTFTEAGWDFDNVWRMSNKAPNFPVILSNSRIPVALEVYEITTNSFIARWECEEIPERYYLDLFCEDVILPAYDNLDVGQTNACIINDLSPDTLYSFKVRAEYEYGGLFESGLVLVRTAKVPYSGGNGTSENPYKITTATELIALGNTPADCNKCFILMNDIDFGAENIDQICIIPEFSGSFDGDGYSIYNFTNSANYDLSEAAGIFGMITNATVMNVSVLDSKVSNPSYSNTGLLVGKAMNSTILNCETSGTVSGYRFTGGVVGWLYHSELDSAASTVSMSGDQSGGGIVGLMHNSNLSRCESVADLTYSTHHIAGIAGFVFDSTIDRCHSSGSVSGDTFIGGVIGRAYDSIISNSYSSSTISGRDDNGGFVGNTVNCSIKDSYSYGKILGNNDANGFIGTRSNSDIVNCFWNTELSGKTTDPAATGITSEQMQYFMTFIEAGWDFDSVWRMSNESPYFPVFGGSPRIPFALKVDINDITTNSFVAKWVCKEIPERYYLDVFYEDVIVPAYDNLDVGQTNAYSIENLSPGTWYSFRVRAEYENGDLFESGLIQVKTAMHAYSGGNGSEENPYQIGKVDDFIDLGNYPYDCDKCFVMIKDIDMGTTMFAKPNVISNFTGSFDGNGCTISNYNNGINLNHGSQVGFFGTLNGAKVANLSFENAAVLNDTNNTAILAGAALSSIIVNCSVEGTVAGIDNTGGMIGSAANATQISNCTSQVIIDGECYVGGIVGSLKDSQIEKSNSSGEVYGSEEVGGIVGFLSRSIIAETSCLQKVLGQKKVGGMVGNTFNSTIDSCFACGSTVGTESVGGLLGYSECTIVVNSYAQGAVYGVKSVGGLSGVTTNKTALSDCYSSCLVEGQNETGGLVGGTTDSTASECFWNKDISGQPNSPLGRGLINSQMQGIDTFFNAGWDFDNVWKIYYTALPFPSLGMKTYLNDTIKITGKIKWESELGNILIQGLIPVDFDNLTFLDGQSFDNLLVVNGKLSLPSGVFKVNPSGISAKATLKDDVAKINISFKLEDGYLSYKVKAKNIYGLAEALNIPNIDTKSSAANVHLDMHIVSDAKTFYTMGDSEIKIKTKKDKKSSFKE